MSWDIVLFNSKERIQSVEDLDESKLETTDFVSILEKPVQHRTKKKTTPFGIASKLCRI